MSRNYDNWERLVDGVVKKDQLWQLCHQPSLSSPSSLSETTSTSFQSSTSISTSPHDSQSSFDGVVLVLSGPRISSRFRNQTKGQESARSQTIKRPRQKMVFKTHVLDDKNRSKAIKVVTGISGIDSYDMDMKEKKLTVGGDFDPVQVAKKLGKSWYTNISRDPIYQSRQVKQLGKKG